MSDKSKKLLLRNGASRLQSISQKLVGGDGARTVRMGERVKLAKIDPRAKPDCSKHDAKKKIPKLQERLAELQQALYAEHRRSLLIVIQAMDTGGKDGVIKVISRGLDPNGVQLTNFKFPSPEEFDHDFLWRVHQAEPRKGNIGIWNRSHYEDVLVPKVHRQITDEVWRQRCEEINSFERLLTRNGVMILKFFLHISKEEQKERLQSRLDRPEKLWKFNVGDLKERKLWDDYQRAYEAVIQNCTTVAAPWHVVPADRKWARNLVILETMIATLEAMDPKYPKADFDPKAIVIE